jgi:hypothetical protein
MLLGRARHEKGWKRYIGVIHRLIDRGWIGGGNIAELKLELIKDRCRGPCGRDGAVPDVAPF